MVPKQWPLRYWDLHFGTVFVALRVLVCEIIPNTRPCRYTHPATHIPMHDRDRIFIECSTPTSRLRCSASVWTRDRMHVMIQTEAMSFILFAYLYVFWTKSKLLPLFTSIFALSGTYFGMFARRAHVRSRTPMILCLQQCPFRRPTFWYLACCATCLGSRDNFKYHTRIHIHIYIPITHPHIHMT